MGTHFESTLKSNRRLYEDDGQSSFIDWGGLSTPQDMGRLFHIGRIHDDCFKALSSNAANRIVRG